MTSRFEIAISPAQVAALSRALEDSLLMFPGLRPDSFDPEFDARVVLRDMLASLVPDSVNDFTA